MTRLLGEGALTGRYLPSDDAEIAAAQVVVGLEFGAPGRGGGGRGASNEAIARHILEHEFDRRALIIAQSSVADALEKARGRKLDNLRRTSGQSSGTLAVNSGAFAELKSAKEIIGQEIGADWSEKVIIDTHAFLAGRAKLQAEKLGLSPLLLPDLPRVFDKDSAQWWCHNPLLWAAREIPGSLALRLRGEL
jgi:hypothetical protein